MHLAGKAGIDAAVKYGLRPTASSGHFSRHLDSVLRWRKHDHSLLSVSVPTFSRATSCRTVSQVPFHTFHEHLALDFADEVGARTRLRETATSGRLPPCYYQHPVVREAAGNQWVIPLAVCLDFVPYAVNDSVLGIWVVNLMNDRRYLHSVLRRRSLCLCGCKGWCSLHPLFMSLVWCLRALAAGTLPAKGP